MVTLLILIMFMGYKFGDLKKYKTHTQNTDIPIHAGINL